MKTNPLFRLITCILAVFAGPVTLRAQVPQMINYQGRIAVGAVNFSGSGAFKFALVNGGGTTTYWSNDGTSTAGSEPAAAITFPVANGIYTLLLGDTSLANMTAIPAAVFTNADVRVRVWFNDGTNGSQMLAPDQRLAAAGSGMIAGTVSDGAITGVKFANGAVGGAQLGAGSIVGNITAGSLNGAQFGNAAVGPAQLASGAVATNLNAAGLGAIPSHGIIFSTTANVALKNAGYVEIGKTQAADAWLHRADGALLTPRRDHSAVWTGSEMIVWGGAGAFNSNIVFNDGGRYNPTTNTWTATSTAGAPSGRSSHIAVWTGTEMIVWAGFAASGAVNDGARYNPASDSWTPTNTVGAPAIMSQPTGVWTGSVMIVWGQVVSTQTNIGSRYNPITNSWAPLTAVNAPAWRSSHTALWTGSEMIVWGGFGAAAGTNTGARYDPIGNTWTTMSTVNVPAGRFDHVAVWTGSTMIVWAGTTTSQTNTGGRYTPSTDTWQPTTLTGAPHSRTSGTAVWSGSEMIIFGGTGATGLRDDHARYNPQSDTWTPVTTGGAAPAREFHSAIWAGREMIVWGGITLIDFANDTWAYSPGSLMYLYQRP